MPLVDPKPSLPPSHLGTVLRAIVDYFARAGDATPVLVGEHYVSDKERGPGFGARVVLVPEPGGGKSRLAAPNESGRVGKQVHSCDVVIRAPESGDDLGRLDAAYALSDRVATCVRRACAGRLEFGSPLGSYAGPTTADALGAGLSWSFTFERDIAHDTKIMALPGAPADTTPARPYEVPGARGSLDTLEGDTVAQE